MRAAAYVRVSDRDQRVDLQRDEIAAAAAGRGDEIAEWYGERASAKSTARAALSALRARDRSQPAEVPGCGGVGERRGESG